MKNLKNVLAAIVIMISAALVLVSFTVIQQKPWEVPAKYKTLKNPTKADQASINTGKMLYTKHCKSCHGATGKGDGPKAATLDTKIRSFSSPEFKKQAPGEIYYKSIIGRGDMPNFEQKITDENDRWAIINYISTL
ncbi:MAG TPA: cytochrome c [Bacteroidia bacterium]|nr:cytochrome c [Bacteroidia bacterium]HRS57759.1 cytochrome c [Bacteroidia bacterium]HRU67300.1 cytochrome c [Bacteroidia bacterium]